MASTATAAPDVSLLRLYVLRATYLLLIVGLGAMIGPTILDHPITDRGIIASLLGGVWILSFLGLRYPLQMLPVLMFELAWKVIWLVAYGLPQWLAGELTPVTSEDMFNTVFGVVLMPLVIPWSYVWRRYVVERGDRWGKA